MDVGGGSHDNVTVPPVTDEVRFDGAPGATIAASNTTTRDRAGHAAAQTPAVTMPVVLAALCVKQLHEVVTGIACAGAVTPAAGRVGDDGDGRIGSDGPLQPPAKSIVATAAHPAAVTLFVTSSILLLTSL